MKVLKKAVDVSDCPLSIATLNAIAQTLLPLSAFIVGGGALHVFSSGNYVINDIAVYCFKHPLLSVDEQHNAVHDKITELGYKLNFTSTTGFVNIYKHSLETFKDIRVVHTEYPDIEAAFADLDIHLTQMLFDGRFVFYTEDAAQNVATKTVTVNKFSSALDSAMTLCKLHGQGFSVVNAMARLLLAVSKCSDVPQAA